VDALGVPSDVVVADGICFRLYARTKEFAPVAHAKLARPKQPATQLFARLTRP
jgi:hypothetical protein